MYCCKDCKREFEYVEIVFERHGLDHPPFERIKLCPFCHSERFFEIVGTHCRYCGSRLSRKGNYCSPVCQKLGEKIWQRENSIKEQRKKSLLELTLKEINEYNKAHNTKLSYGEYVALRKEKTNGKKGD